MDQFVAALFLLIIASFVHLIARKFKLPFTILLFIVGILLIPLSWYRTMLGSFSLTPDLLFYVFLPILIFESAYTIKYHHLNKNSFTIWSLATIGLLISAVGIGFGLHYGLHFFGIEIPLMITLLFGVIISATDPVAVLAIFKDLWAPKRLSLLFEWESLFNDWTAVAIFLILIEIIHNWTFNANTLWLGLLQFLVMVIGGIILWVFFGLTFSKWIKYIKNNESVEIALTMILAHFTFILAEYISHHIVINGFDLKISGVIATAYAAIIMWNYGKTKISPKVEEYMEKFWKFFAFLSNSLIFLLMWLVVKKISIPIQDARLPVSIAIILVTIMRMISIYLPISILNQFPKLQQKISIKRQHLMAWWSLRWVVWLTLALMIPEWLELTNRNLNYSMKDFILLLVISVIIFSLLVKGLTIKKLIQKLKLDSLCKLEIFESIETEIIVYDEIIKKINRMKTDYHTSKENYNSLMEKYTAKYNESILKMQIFLNKQTDKQKLIYKALSLQALWIEKDYLQQMFKYNEIDEYLYLHRLAKIERQILRVEKWEKQLRSKKNKTKHPSIIRFLFRKYSMDEMSDHDLYIVYRTKFIITNKVINQLSNLQKIDFGYDKKHFDSIINLYKKFHDKSRYEINQLLDNNIELVIPLNEKLLNKWLLKTEEKIMKDLLHKEMITDKLYKQFMSDIENEILEWW